MSDAFSRAFDWMIPHEAGSDPEGGYTKDPRDPGGETRWGIAKRFHPEVDVQNLTKDAAKEIYRAGYWDPIHGDAISNVSYPIAAKVFDIGVNIGVIRAAKMLQSGLNDLGSAIAVDGRIGAGTITALAHADPGSVMDRLVTRQTNYYLSLNNERFQKGWLRRAKEIPPSI